MIETFLIQIFSKIAFPFYFGFINHKRLILILFDKQNISFQILTVGRFSSVVGNKRAHVLRIYFSLQCSQLPSFSAPGNPPSDLILDV